MKFLYPVSFNSTITQTFEEHVHRAQVYHLVNYNGGIDWALDYGTSVKAAQAGKVKAVRNDASGYGLHIRIQHDGGYLTIYGHLLSAGVAVDDEVNPGQVIGKSDNTGYSSGPHLHFEVRLNNQPIDPMPLLVQSVTALTTEAVEAQETPIDLGSEPTKFPILPKVRVVTTILRVRSQPGITGLHLTNLVEGTEVEVIRKIVQGDDIWLQIGHDQFVAMKYAGDIYAVWSKQ